MTYALGIDLGGTSVKTVSVTPGGEPLHQGNFPFASDTKMDWAVVIRSILQEATQRHKTPPAHVGISAPGLAAANGRSVARMPGRLHGLEGLDWTEYLEFHASIPVLNDAHAALLGEAWLGAARGFKNVFMLTLGTGVGGAAIVDGRLLKGRLGRAGHIGHVSLDVNGPRDICQMPGSVEVLVGNCTIEERSGGRFKTTHELVAAHLTGHAEATRVWLHSVRALGCAISSMINVLDPEAVIIGGGIARSGAALFEPLEAAVRDTEWDVGAPRVPIIPAQLSDLAGAYGAASAAFSHLR